MSRIMPILNLSPLSLTNIRSKCYINVSFRAKFRFMRGSTYIKILFSSFLLGTIFYRLN